MPGPPPKDPKLKQRRNKSATRKTLYLANNDFEPPELPSHRRWHKQVKYWWVVLWDSPMAGEYLEADIPALFALALLMDKFWKGNVSLAAEIRQRQQAFGLTPLDRRRLEWQIVQAEEAKDKREIKRGKRAKIVEDPRGILE